MSVFLALGQLAAVAHQFSAGHRTCEHGQVVEAEGDSPGLSHEVGEAESAHLIAAEEERAEATHAHCLAAALLRQAAACPGALLPQTPAALATAAGPSARTGFAVPREVLLLLAPKASPPA